MIVKKINGGRDILIVSIIFVSSGLVSAFAAGRLTEAVGISAGSLAGIISFFLLSLIIFPSTAFLFGKAFRRERAVKEFFSGGIKRISSVSKSSRDKFAGARKKRAA